ncbi:MAG: BACON domain-containing protein, partial [Ktedonobacteraceae bacterium]
ISRPRGLKVPHFFAMGSNSAEDADTILLSKHSAENTVVSARRSPRFSSDSTILTTPTTPTTLATLGGRMNELLEDGRHNTNWHKIVDERDRPPRTPSQPRIPVTPPYTPLPQEYILMPPPQWLKARRKPSLFFWVSTLLVGAVIFGGLLGVIVTLGRGARAQISLHNTSMSLQITPATVALGALITVRGTNFSPYTSVGLTRDTVIPIVDTGSNTIIRTDGKGNFTDTVIVAPEWQAGLHIIRAEDAHLHKTAAFTIVVTGHSALLRPAHLLLSTSVVDLGSGDQATNGLKLLTLTNAGGGQISWQSTTTQPWLMLSPKSGAFSSGQAIHVMIAAERANLKPGSYTGQVIFTSNAGQATLPVKMKTTQLQPDNKAVLQLTPPVLSFTGADGSANPPGQVITVSNPGVQPLQWSASINGGNDWLAVTPLTGSIAQGGSQSLVANVNSSNLLPGTYSAMVTFESQDSGSTKDSPQSVYISFTIVPQCILQVSPGNLTFAGVYQQSSPAPKVISVNGTQSCRQQLKWNTAITTNNGGKWLNISPGNGTTSANPSVSVNAAGLGPGHYYGTIVFSTARSTQTLPVTLTIAQAMTPILGTSRAQMSFNAIIGSSQAPVVQGLTLTNTGGGALHWHISASTNFGGSWLSVTRTSGNLATHVSADVGVGVSVLAGLTPNTYTGAITVTATDSAGRPAVGSPQLIFVTFIVLPACTISVAPAALNFAGVSGQADPAAQAATITAHGTCTHTLIWTVSTNSPWITATPTSGSVSLSAASRTHIGVVLSGLGANTYRGRVSISAIDSVTHQSAGAAQTIAVSLTVQPPCTLQAPSAASAFFNSEVGTNPNPASQKFTIGVFGACTGNITITPTEKQGWLTVTPKSATITRGAATFTVTVTSTALNADTYEGTISLAAVNASGMTISGSPQTVAVTLKVLAPPVLKVSPGTLTVDVTTGTTSQPISISNTGSEPLNWTAAPGADAPAFVSLSTSSGTNLGGGTSTSLGVIVDATGVAGGSTFTISVIVSAIDPLTGNVVAGSPSTVSITIHVAPPAMQISTNALTYTTSAGVAPSLQALTITNTGGNGLTWSVGPPSQPWLTLGLTSGSDNAGATSIIPMHIDVQGLASGVYTAQIVITPSVGQAQTITVTLNVN